jgi:hypothetical protein
VFKFNMTIFGKKPPFDQLATLSASIARISSFSHAG